METNVKNKLKSEKESNVNDYINESSKLIEKEKLLKKRHTGLRKETVDGFREHVNPGFSCLSKNSNKRWTICSSGMVG